MLQGRILLRTWIFTIASNLAKDNLRVRKRWTENITDITRAAALSDQQFFQEAMQIRMISPQGQYEAREHIALFALPVFQSHCPSNSNSAYSEEVYEFR